MTRQIQDELIYRDNPYYLNRELLEAFFAAFPEQRPEFEGFMTALWRGYRATFEINNNELLIKHINWFYLKNDFNHDAFMQANFPNNKYAWFSGLIRIDDHRGEYDEEDNEDAIYELLEIKKGDLINHWKLTYDNFIAFKEILFEDFKKTNNYETLLGLWTKNNPGLAKEKIDTHIYNRIIAHVTEI